MIERKKYTDWLIRHRNDQLIKVITGVRRSGKSTLFTLYQEILKKDGVQEDQIIHLNFEDLRYYDLRDFLKLNEYILERTNEKQDYYLFFDEIQNVTKFEEVVNSLNLQKNIDIYVTGSNAFFMSGEFATLLTGRHADLEVLPLSFKEFQSQYSQLSLADTYERYKHTAFPRLVSEESVQERNDYIRSTYNDIVLKDIVQRYKITEQDILERVLQFIASSVGSEVSINRINNFLKDEKVAKSNNTVERYVDAFVNGLIIYKVPRYNIKGRQILQRLEKYYLVDLGFRELLLPLSGGDEGHFLENIIYLELRRRYVKVYVGKNDKTEVDFVCIDHENHQVYYQVALQTLDEKVLARELRSLEAIDDMYPKYLLTLDTINKNANYNGIIKKNALDWLLEDEE
ncbi:ATPase component BioM [Lactococcus cremoris]|uniref:ATPase component BioM n=1 Tax=Lactococcus lactis subsp. cremoris TaxID=1359 RepID=A0A166IZY7_LACLC|nr:ATP-binding protein [Lactococcus cremoris]KZK05283.1 ATPase component BioM [Lactococcus cremoris]